MTVELVLGPVAHGGFVVGRHDGKVLFVTGGLPGERVSVEVTERGRRYDRARVVEVLEAVPGRVEPPCAIASECGGCDWQFADQPTQLDLKTAVVEEQLRRLAGIDWGGRVEAVPGGLTGWRTRTRLAVDDEGRLGFRARRSHAIVPLPEAGCLIADHAPYDDATRVAEPRAEVIVAVGTWADTCLGQKLGIGPDPVRQQVFDRTFEVAADGFWQAHREAPEVLTRAVLEGLEPQRGESALDLYCGVGLFAGALIDSGCRVSGVETGNAAVALARRNVPEARFTAAPVERALRDFPDSVDLVVLDPPRKGAGEKVVRAVAGMAPRAIAYVACDPAALARDLAHFADHGYVASDIKGFDLFPMTHHVECVAILRARG
ncbi:TRAM domain-containing protein [Tessaracoccus bendigoensis DSM 12906]|uniref:TRAM domain-containing protein n=1 Tax=Tessaracoccus bendigoensis DSM 12906 TaxID=1123357 RepID=A0A1M6KM50_9ACTN|nr:TRAM domain-containing protein [Tessaracoccus bendigoensis]SHJ60009.1 TRAM domain-containing protein [Tessaracoccus bendigoensis DSM 12906]